MNKESISKTESLAPILKEMGVQKPNYKHLTCLALRYLNLGTFAQSLCEKRQDWEELWEGLSFSLENDSAYRQAQKVLDALPGTTREIGEKTDLHPMTISQTLNALKRGGCGIPVTYEVGLAGAPVKVFHTVAYEAGVAGAPVKVHTRKTDELP